MNEANKRFHRSRNNSEGTEVSKRGLAAQASGRMKTNNPRSRAQQNVVPPRCLLLQHHSSQERLDTATGGGQGRWWLPGQGSLGNVHGETVPRLRDRVLLTRAASHPFP